MITTEFIIAMLALAGGPLSAALGYWLNKRHRDDEMRLRMSEAQERMEGELWNRMKSELSRAYERIDELSTQLDGLRQRVQQLERENHDLRVENHLLRGQLNE